MTPIRESEIQRDILRMCQRRHIRLWRSNAGMIQAKGTGGKTYMYRGAPAGTADIVGWKKENGVAVFVALEVKRRGGKPTESQQQFIADVWAAGGIAGIVYSVDEAMRLLGIL